MDCSTASRTGPAGVALAAGPAADQGQLTALRTWIALVAFQARQANLFLQADVAASIARPQRFVAVARLRQRVQVAAARQGEHTSV